METSPDSRLAPSVDDLNSLDFPINPERAGPVLRRLVSTADIRARIYRSRRPSRGRQSRSLLRGELCKPNCLRSSRAMRYFGWAVWQQVQQLAVPQRISSPARIRARERASEFPEVTAALNGASVSIVRVNDQNEIIVSVAVPIQRFRAVLGSLVLSTTGGEIDKVLRGERKAVLSPSSFAVLVTILLSVLLAGHIAEPIRRLSAAADRVGRGVNNRVEIPDFTSTAR